MKPLEGVEPIIKLLAVLLVFFSLLVIFCDWRFQNDGQVFQVFSNIMSGIAGAILVRVKPPNATGDDKSTTLIGKVVETPSKTD